MPATPIRRRLMTALLLTSGVVMLITSSAFCAYDFLTYRQQTLHNLATLGDAIAANSTAALAFQNPDDAREVLSALRAESHIVDATLFTSDGKLFASYPARRPAVQVAVPPPDGYRFEGGYLIGVQPVVQGQRRMGSLVSEGRPGCCVPTPAQLRAHRRARHGIDMWRRLSAGCSPAETDIRTHPGARQGGGRCVESAGLHSAGRATPWLRARCAGRFLQQPVGAGRGGPLTATEPAGTSGPVAPDHARDWRAPGSAQHFPGPPGLPGSGAADRFRLCCTVRSRGRGSSCALQPSVRAASPWRYFSGSTNSRGCRSTPERTGPLRRRRAGL